MAYKDIILADDPVIYWRFNESVGSLTFDEIQGIPLNYHLLNAGNVIQQMPGLINDSNFSVELSNSFARAIVPYNYATPGSFEVWFQATNVISDQATLITNYRDDNDWSMRLRTINLGGQIVLEANTTQGLMSLPATGINFNDGEIYYVVITYDGNNLIIYVNGIVRGFLSGITVLDSITDFAAIGNEYSGGITTQYNGFIDEAAFYNYALPESIQLLHYNTGINPPAPSSTGGIFASLINVNNLSVNPSP